MVVFLDVLFPLFLLVFVPAVLGFLIGSFFGCLLSYILDKRYSFNEKIFLSLLLHFAAILLGYYVSSDISFALTVPGFELYYPFKIGMFLVVYAFILFGIKFTIGRLFVSSWDFGLIILKRVFLFFRTLA